MDDSRTDTHKLYDTINHIHIDLYMDIGTLMIVTTRDNSYFVEAQFPDEKYQLQGISYPFVKPYQEPQFFNTIGKAFELACECIKQAEPDKYDENKEFLEEQYNDLFKRIDNFLDGNNNI